MMRLKIPNSHYLTDALLHIDDNYSKLNCELVVYETNIRSMSGGRLFTKSVDFTDKPSNFNNIKVASLMSNYFYKNFEDNNKINSLLDYLDATGGEVIISKVSHAKYIRNNFRNIKTTLSCTWFSFNETSVLNNFKLYSYFDYICLLPDENRIIDKIPKELLPFTEVITNEFCVPNCKERKTHYESISKDALGKESKFKCPHSFDIRRLNSMVINVNKMIDKGVVNFKCGRRTPYDSIKWVTKFTDDNSLKYNILKKVKIFSKY